MGELMEAGDVVRTLDGLARVGIDHWVIGGWGIDALLGRQTREHHDLDLLIRGVDLPLLHDYLGRAGFSWLHDWQESRALTLGETTYQSAFVVGDENGKQIDIHVVTSAKSGSVWIENHDRLALPADALVARGSIGGRTVACVSAAAQRVMHRGYDLPPQQILDLAAIEGV